MAGPPDIDPHTGLAVRPAPNAYPFGPATVAAVLEDGLREHPDQVALVAASTLLTYRELDSEVARVAGAIDATTDRGDVVGWSLPNSIDLVVGFLATLRAGRLWFGLNPRLPAAARSSLVARSEARIVVDAEHTWPAARPLASVPVDPHAPAAMSATSGTTGEPKLVVHSQHGLLWPGLSGRVTDPVVEDDRTLCSLPLTTLTLMILGPLTALLRGGSAVVGVDPSAMEVLSLIRRHDVSRLVAVPTLLHDLAAQIERTGEEPPAALHTVLVGGAGTTPELRERFEARVGLRPTLSYGLSETPTGVARTDAEHPHSASAMPPVVLSIRDDSGRGRVAGEVGRVRIDPVQVGPWADTWRPMLGYWRQPEATAAVLDGDGLLTDDLGLIDEDGRLRVVGRRSDVIVRGGTNVMPAEVESAIRSHPGVLDVAVVGVPDDRLGEVVAAAVVPEDDTLTARQVRDHARSSLTGDRVPEEIRFVADLPRNALGKVVRPEVEALFA